MKTVHKIPRPDDQDYVVHRTMALPFGGQANAVHLTANVVASLMRKPVDQHGHHLRHFPKGIRDLRGRGDRQRDPWRGWYLRQMLAREYPALGDARRDRQPLAPDRHHLAGHAEQQVCRGRAQGARAHGAPRPEVRLRPLLTQAASVYVQVVELSLPNKVPGRRRRDMIKACRQEGLADPEPGPLQLTQSRGASRPVVQLLPGVACRPTRWGGWLGGLRRDFWSRPNAKARYAVGAGSRHTSPLPLGALGNRIVTVPRETDE